MKDNGIMIDKNSMFCKRGGEIALSMIIHEFRIKIGSEIDLFMAKTKFCAEIITVRFYGLVREIKQLHYIFIGFSLSNKIRYLYLSWSKSQQKRLQVSG